MESIGRCGRPVAAAPVLKNGSIIIFGFQGSGQRAFNKPGAHTGAFVAFLWESFIVNKINTTINAPVLYCTGAFNFSVNK
jgi:hypothetical protein